MTRTITRDNGNIMCYNSNNEKTKAVVNPDKTTVSTIYYEYQLSLTDPHDGIVL